MQCLSDYKLENIGVLHILRYHFQPDFFSYIHTLEKRWCNIEIFRCVYIT